MYYYHGSYYWYYPMYRHPKYDGRGFDRFDASNNDVCPLTVQGERYLNNASMLLTLDIKPCDSLMESSFLRLDRECVKMVMKSRKNEHISTIRIPFSIFRRIPFLCGVFKNFDRDPCGTVIVHK